MAGSRQLINKAPNSFEPRPTPSSMFQKQPFAAEPEQDEETQSPAIQAGLENSAAAPFNLDIEHIPLFPPGSPAYSTQAKSGEEAEPGNLALQRRIVPSPSQQHPQEAEVIEDEASLALKAMIRSRLMMERGEEAQSEESTETSSSESSSSSTASQAPSPTQSVSSVEPVATTQTEEISASGELETSEVTTDESETKTSDATTGEPKTSEATTGNGTPQQASNSSAGSSEASSPTGQSQQTESSGDANAATGGATNTSSATGAQGQGSGGAAAVSQVPQSPEADPSFQAVVQNIGGVAATEQEHNPAVDDAGAAQAAARSPINETQSQAQNQHVGVMEQQEPGTFDAEAFKSSLLSKIAEIIPETEESAQDFGDNNELDSIRDDVSSDVAAEQENAAGPIQEAAETEPDASQFEARVETPLEPQDLGVATPDVGASEATPSPRPEAEITTPLAANVEALDQQMAEANVTEEQLENSGEPAFQSAVAARSEVANHSASAPATYRQQEQGVLSQAQSGAQSTSQQQLTAMHGDRETILNQVGGEQTTTQTQDETERTRVATEINNIYDRTKTDVDGILGTLDLKVTEKFDEAAGRAKDTFEDYVERKMEAWEDERYGEFWDVTGYDERLSDAWNGLPPEVDQFFVDGKQKYIDEMDTALTEIAELVSTKLNEAKERITQGRQEIQTYVDELPESLKQYGEEAAQSIQARFDELETAVNSKQDELVNSLAQRYRDSLQAVNTRIEEMQAANRGLKELAAEALGGAIQTILELKDMLMGILARASGAIDQIILDPVEFLGNLIEGVQLGFENFVANIEEHLKQGLVGWLTGTLAEAGIQMPETFDLAGIFSLVMQVLGLTYESIKGRAIEALGPQGEAIFTALETAFKVFEIIRNEGIAGLWQFIQEKVGDLQVMVMDTIQNFVIETVIKQGVLWVISLLNPASAFVKACKMIYDVVIFFVERGSQIIDLVNAVIDSVSAIASGAIGGAAAMIEGALSQALPVVISFMASLLGLGGISNKIREVIDTIKAPIDEAIDWIIQQAIDFAKTIGKALGFGNSIDGEDGEQTTEGEGEQLEDSEVGKVINFTADDERHRLWISTQGTSAEVMVASTPMTMEAKLNDWQGRLKTLSKEDQVGAQSLISTARQQLSTTEQSAQKTMQEIQEAKKDAGNETAINKAKTSDNQTENQQNKLVEVIRQLLSLFGEDSENNKMKLVELTFNCNTLRYNPSEYQQQLNRQEAGINTMKIEEWETNRQRYVKEGRAKEGSKAQKHYREKEKARLIAEKIEELVETRSLSVKEAEPIAVKEVEKFMKTQAALHDPDQIAGGDPTHITGLGDKRINSSIGSQWKREIKNLSSKVAAEKKRKGMYMNVKLMMNEFQQKD